MSDDTQKELDDALLDDDLDFSDFDDDLDDDLDDDVDLGADDLDVDDWDGVEDGNLDVDPIEAENRSSERTFLQKNFNLIVIGVVLLGGGGFALTQLGGGAPAPLPVMPVDQVDQEIAAPDMGEMPPAPAAVDVSDNDDFGSLPMEFDDLDVADDSALPAVAENDSGALTPLPSFDDAPLNDLPPLDVLDDVPALDLAEADPVFDDLDAASDVADDNFDADLEVIVNEPLADIPVVDDVVANELRFEEPVVDAPVQDNVSQDAFIENTFEPVVEVIADKSEELADALAREAALLEAQNTDRADINDAQDKISSLEGQVGALEDEVRALNEALAKAQVAADKAATRAPKVAAVSPSVAKAPVAAPVKKPVPAPKAAAKTVKAEPVKWTLRAAQPGKAMVYNAATQDVLSIEVGDDVPGIGRVKSIAVENGLWVVDGQSGRISQ